MKSLKKANFIVSFVSQISSSKSLMLPKTAKTCSLKLSPDVSFYLLRFGMFPGAMKKTSHT